MVGRDLRGVEIGRERGEKGGIEGGLCIAGRAGIEEVEFMIVAEADKGGDKVAGALLGALDLGVNERAGVDGDDHTDKVTGDGGAVQAGGDDER